VVRECGDDHDMMTAIVIMMKVTTVVAIVTTVVAIVTTVVAIVTTVVAILTTVTAADLMLSHGVLAAHVFGLTNVTIELNA